jgi:hypothetical protein
VVDIGVGLYAVGAALLASPFIAPAVKRVMSAIKPAPKAGGSLTRADAFAAAEVLVAFFEATDHADGLAAARDVGRALYTADDDK